MSKSGYNKQKEIIQTIRMYSSLIANKDREINELIYPLKIDGTIKRYLEKKIEEISIVIVEMKRSMYSKKVNNNLVISYSKMIRKTVVECKGIVEIIKVIDYECQTCLQHKFNEIMDLNARIEIFCNSTFEKKIEECRA